LHFFAACGRQTLRGFLARCAARPEWGGRLSFPFRPAEFSVFRLQNTPNDSAHSAIFPRKHPLFCPEKQGKFCASPQFFGNFHVKI